MEKFYSIELSRENTNPTSICKIYIEYAKFSSNRAVFAKNVIEKYIADHMVNFDVDGDFLANQLDKLIEEYFNESLTKTEKEKLCEVIYINLIKIPIAFAIQAIQADSNNQTNEAWLYSLDAAYWTGMLKGREISPSVDKVLSLNGLKGATAKLASCPKQYALNQIKFDYEANKSQFKRRGFSAQFIRNMHTKYPIITSIKTIENLVAALNKDNELIPR